MTTVSRAAIVAVGSELLTPSRIDTNSLYVTEQLNRLGIDVVAKAVVGDDRVGLAATVRTLLERADLVVATGGLGPTDDDVTREAIAAALDRPLSEDPAITDALRRRFAARGLGVVMPEINRRQAMVPAGADTLENPHGSAPGLWIESGDRVVVLLPGPPRELKPMLAALIDGRLRERSAGVPLLRRVVRVTGRFESQVDERLAPLYRSWEARAPAVAATILASPGTIELHLSSRAASVPDVEVALDAAVSEAVSALGDDAYSSDGSTLEQVVGDLLVARGLRVGVAESCTGGLVSSRLTDVPGSSRYVDLAVVTYADAAKIGMLDVPADLIATHGAVSEAVVSAMAHGVRLKARADIGVAVSGIAGPDGGVPGKPVGTVHVAAVTATLARTRVFRFLGDRGLVKFQASQAALDMVRRLLLDRP
jgi:nicotinamide-nucleotide amidase